METIIGLLGIYVWVHSIVIVSTKVENTNTYEKILLILSVVLFVLFFIGSVPAL